MSRTIIQHPNGERTVVTKRSGCGGCFWVLLGVFVVFAPAAWVGSGSLPLGAAIGMYAVLAVVVVAGVAQRMKRRQVARAPMQAWPPPPPPPPPALG